MAGMGRTWGEARLFRPDLGSLTCSAEGFGPERLGSGKHWTVSDSEGLAPIFPMNAVILYPWGSLFLRLLLGDAGLHWGSLGMGVSPRVAASILLALQAPVVLPGRSLFSLL